MSTPSDTTNPMPDKYSPPERLVDNKDRLQQLYCKDGLTIREIATEYAEVSRSVVCNAIQDHGLTDEDSLKENHKDENDNSDRDVDPPEWTDHTN